MKKRFFKSLVAMFLLGSALTVASCGGTTNNPTTDNPTTATPTPTTEVPAPTTTVTPTTTETPAPTTSEEKSVIKSLTALAETFELRVGDKKAINIFYDLKGNGALNNKQKQCTYVSDNEEVISIPAKSKFLYALKTGSANITVTSDADKTKTCTFRIDVKDVYFDHESSSITPEDDFTKELPADGGIVESKGMLSGDYFVKGVNSTVWMTEVEITIKEVFKDEKYPKFGIVASAMDNAAEGSENRVYFFLDAAIGGGENYSWRNFGFCEVYNGGSWAWNPGVGNAVARHADACYTLPEGEMITATSKLKDGETTPTKFKMKVAHDGLDFHMWINDTYAASMTVLPYLFSDADGNPVNSTCGFFQFNSWAVYENYSVTQDADTVRAEINKIENKRFLAGSDWAAD